MIYVALATLGVLALTVALTTALFAKLVRQHARERDLLLNQLLNLAGRPWQPPPSEPDWAALAAESEPEFEDVDQVLP